MPNDDDDHALGEFLMYGRCDTCGEPCNAEGCTADPTHATGLDVTGDDLDLDDLADMAGIPTADAMVYVHKEGPAIPTLPERTGRCECPPNPGQADAGGRCRRKGSFWVQRGPINRKSCTQHLASTVREFHGIAPGWYNKSKYYEGYYISSWHSIVVKMQKPGSDGWS